VIVGLSADLFGDSRACIWENYEVSGLYEVRDLNAEGGVSGFVLTAANAINNRNQIIATGRVAGTGELRAYYLDPDDPISVQGVTINSGQAQRSRINSIALTLSSSVSLSADSLSLHNDTTGEVFALDTVPFDDATDTWDLSALTLSDGEYTATLAAGEVATHEFDFHVLHCDIDGDQEVGDGDYQLLKGQFGLRGSALASDLNNDGRVSLSDFAAIRANFGNTLPAPAPEAAEAPVAEPLVSAVSQPQPTHEPIEAPAIPSAPAASPVASQPLESVEDAYDDLIIAASPVPAVDSQTPVPLPDIRIAELEAISADLPAAPRYYATTTEYALRPLTDDPAAGDGDDLLADILAESELLPPL